MRRPVDDAVAHRLLGDAKEKNGDPVGAVEEYEIAVKIEPSEENYFVWGAELSAASCRSGGGGSLPEGCGGTSEIRRE